MKAEGLTGRSRTGWISTHRWRMAYLRTKTIFVLSLWASLLYVALMTLPLEADTPKTSLYVWKTGVWGVCVAGDCGSIGLQNRSVWCIHAEGWSTHQSKCFPSERPSHQRVCVKMCEWQKDLFEWRSSPWGPCTPFLPTDRCVTAQRGVQSRDLLCVRRPNGTAVSPRMCEAFSPAPEREQACLLPCPIDCVVSAFSHWSSCSRTCGSALQQRTRHVLATPLYGGADCPSLTQTRPCNHDNAHPALCPSDQQEYSYSLWVGPWSPCRVKVKAPVGKTTVDFGFGLDEKTAAKASYFVKRHTEKHYDDKRGHKALWDITVGYQTRQLRCTRSDGKNSMLSLCDHDNSPVNFRSCVMPRDCKVSDWSTWSPCSKTCRVSDESPGVRSRHRSLTRPAIGAGESCPALLETQRCNILDDTLPLCPRYEWQVTNWNPCQVTPLLSQQDHRHSNTSILCGGGIQTREAYCVRIHNNTAPSHIQRPVARTLCTGPLPPLARSCSISCRKHCPLTPWSPWGLCLHDNCLEPQGKKGFRVRTRSVITESWVESHSCPHISEAMICDDPICFLWRVTSQGPCVPHNGSCGSGTQERTVKCFSVTGEAVSSESCPGDRPPAHQSCEMLCPGDCVLGDWTSWSSCSQSCSSQHFKGKQTRSRSVLALPGEQGKPCSPDSELEQFRSCATHSCTVYYWDTSPWEPCMPDSITDGGEMNSTGQMENEVTCGTGVQKRQVTCRKAGNGHVVQKRCPESSRPESIRSCSLPCIMDCIVTPFSEWSSCPTTCSPVNATVSTQSRHRIIIQRPANGGQECPDTLYEERECDPPSLCPVYRWQTHRWHQCILVPDWVRQAVGGPTEACGSGLELRDVACVGADDAPADMSDCLRWAGVMPMQVRECRVSCRNECTFTSWSRFTGCQGCGSWRTRNRSLIGRSKKHWRCQRQDLFPLQQKEVCPCSVFHTQPHGPWSPCLLPPTNHRAGHPFIQGVYQKAVQNWRDQRKNSECGPGKRYRAIACLDHTGRLVEPDLCSSSGYEEEACHVPCSADCRLSEWSHWSTCSASCGGGVKVRSQWLREKPFNGGRPCPQLNYKNQAQVSEVLHCYSKCSQYVWDVSSWSMCIINTTNTNYTTHTTPEQPVCGEGLRTRQIRCVKTDGQSQDESVDDSLCDQEEQPITAERCLLPCPAHCVTSEWSQWTKCTVDCSDGDLRWRSRSVLRWPEDDHICPDLNQTQPCNNMTCLKYSYVYSDWSSCQIGKNAVCGRGIKTRLLNCVHSDGKLVELSMCKELGPSRGKLSAPCEVGCPVNCLLTEWSNWSECSHTCGSQSLMTRTRIVLQSAEEGGRPCPSQLSQTRSCPIRPCYSWRLGDWSSCRVEGADCGEGVSRREMSCVVHWGSLSGPPQPVPVEDLFCMINSQSKVSELRQPCTIPCPGECHLTAWSPWSSCQLLCLDGRSFETWGRQARSRAVVTQVAENQDSCPSQVYETQPCQGGTCLSYEWMTGDWRNNRRLVWCQRSDGVNVTGGCNSQHKPSTVRQCHPPCTKPFSFCTQSGVCGCEKGFTEVMTSHGFLDYCTRRSGLDHTKADVKTSVGHPRPQPARNKYQVKDWALQPLGPDGRVKLWVYGLMAAGFILILLLIVMSFLLCKNPGDGPSSSPQKAMALAYDGDVDM